MLPKSPRPTEGAGRATWRKWPTCSGGYPNFQVDVPVLVLDVSAEEADLLLAALDPIGAMARTGR